MALNLPSKYITYICITKTKNKCNCIQKVYSLSKNKINKPAFFDQLTMPSTFAFLIEEQFAYLALPSTPIV